MRLRRIRKGETIRAQDINEIIEAVNRLTIRVGPGLKLTEEAGGITISLNLQDTVYIVPAEPTT